MLRNAIALFEVLRSPGGWRALARRPRSIASFQVVRGLVDEGLGFRTVIDAGANRGQFARAARSEFPDCRLLCFEPLPDVAAELRRNLRDVDELQVFEVALGSSDGRATLHRGVDTQTSSVLPTLEGAAGRGGQPASRVEVSLQTIDTALDGVDLDPPVLLKLDLQGYEVEALRGASRTLGSVSHVVVESAFEPAYAGEPLFDQTRRLLENGGFRFVRPLRFMSDPRGRILQVDALFASRS